MSLDALLDEDAFLSDLEAKLPFWAYSSRNRPGGATDAAVEARRNAILELWWRHYTIDEIAGKTRLSIDAVKHYVMEARRIGDPRAAERMDWRLMQSTVTRFKINRLHRQGFSASEIAHKLNVTRRLVEIRLAECRT